MMNRTLPMLAFSLAGIVGLSVDVHAQQNDGSSADSLAIDEVIVTAQKRPESLQDVPISVSVLSGDFIDSMNINRFDELQTNVPTYLDAKYLDYPDGQCLFGATEADGCMNGTMNLAGVQLERAPEWSGSLSLDFEQSLGETAILSLNGSLTYTDRTYLQPDLDANDSAPGHTLLNARVSLGSSDNRMELALLGKNLTDELVKNFSIDTPFFGGGAHTASIAARRTVQLIGTYRW
jgi:outer membrane receptor protein involved in Fe transport